MRSPAPVVSIIMTVTMQSLRDVSSSATEHAIFLVVVARLLPQPLGGSACVLHEGIHRRGHPGRRNGIGEVAVEHVRGVHEGLGTELVSDGAPGEGMMGVCAERDGVVPQVTGILGDERDEFLRGHLADRCGGRSDGRTGRRCGGRRRRRRRSRCHGVRRGGCACAPAAAPSARQGLERSRHREHHPFHRAALPWSRASCAFSRRWCHWAMPALRSTERATATTATANR